MISSICFAISRKLQFRLFWLFWLFLFLSPWYLFAQHQAIIDSIQAMTRSLPASERGEAYLALTYAYGMDDPSNAYLAAEEAVHLALDQGDSLLLAKGYNSMGRWKRYTGGSIQRAISILHQATAIAKRQGYANEEFNGHYEMASTYHWLYDQNNFNLHFDACNALVKEIDSPTLMGKFSSMKTFSLWNGYQADSVPHHFANALAYFKKAEAVEGIIGVKLTMSLGAMRERDLDAAKALRGEALSLSRSIQSDYYTFSALMYVANFGIGSYDSTQQAQLLRELDQLAGSLQNKRGLIDYNMFKLREMVTVGNGLESLVYAKEFKRLSQELSINTYLVQSSFQLSAILEQEGRFLEALEEILSVKEVALEVDYLVSFVYAKIADLYLALEEPELALEYQQEARAYDLASHKPITFHTNYFNYLDFADIYEALERLEEAELYIDSALSLAREYQQSDKVMEALAAKSRLALEAGELQKAKQALAEAFEIAELTPGSTESVVVSQMHHTGALLSYKSGDYTQSIFHAEHALLMTRESRWAEGALHNHEVLWQAYEAIGQPGKALEHMKQYHLIKDSLFSLEKTAAVLQLKETYESEQKELKIELLEQEQALQELALASQSQILLRSRLVGGGIAVFAITLLLIGWLLFNRYKLRVKADELVLQNESYRLEQEHAKATQQLEIAEMRTSFLTNISHEIRTPLTLIKGPVSQWKEAPESIDSRALEQVDFNTDRLLILVDEAMNVARLENASLPFRPEKINAAAFFRKQLDSFSSKAEAQQVKLVFEDHSHGIDCSMDTYRMERVVLNLVGNALRYTPKNGTIHLLLSVVEGRLGVKVSDTGIGIEAQHLSSLFQRFYRADNHQEQGYGLGLAIVKEAVELHGGTIDAESRVGEGTRFTILLPLHQEIPEQSSSFTEEVKEDLPAESLVKEWDADTKADDPSTVLVVEDDPSLREYLIEILSGDHRVLTAGDGKAGEEIALQEFPDLIVSDIMMPHKNGLEMVATLKKNLLTSHIPVVLLTAKADQKDKLSGLSAGADYYLKKPFSPKELQLCTRNMVQQQQRLRQKIGSAPLSTQKTSDGLTVLDREFLDKANRIVKAHLDDDTWTIEQFCQELALNRSSVHVKLKALTGHNASGFIRNLRIHKAAELIKEESCSLAEVADLTGFSSRQAFNRAFKIHLGMSPSGFKEQQQKRV